MTVYSASVSMGGQMNDGDFEHHEAGETTVRTMPTRGGVVNEESYNEYFPDTQAPGVVTRNGSQVHINDISEVQGTDLVTIDDGSGQGIQVEVSTLKAMGLGHLLDAHVAGENPAEEYDQLQELDRLSRELDDSPDRVVRSNLNEAVESGDMNQRTFTAANLLYDTGEMLGASAQDTLNYAMNALETGDYSQIAAMGIDEGNARSVISTAYDALTSAAEAEVGQIAMIELERAGTAFPTVRQAILQVGAGVLSGQMGRGAWTELHNQVMKVYGQRLNALR